MDSSRTIINPILKGFNPDPSIIRVGDDYYIATSTFEWFPGVQIHHSRDLINWRLLTRPLTRVSQLDMRGVPNSGGIWAPCLTWHNDIFYLLYTNVLETNGVTRDTPNYMVTATDIMGPWSDPVYLNSSGFDPSLFHDDDGKKWVTNMVWDHRPNKSHFYGIALQEFSPEEQKLVGKSRIIFKGTDLDCTEAPHIYKRNGYYYLITAEGGTSWEHAVTIARSRHIGGPYEVHPMNPLLTAWGDKTLPVLKTGHADIVETQHGDWYITYLCARPVPGRDRCIMGRESAIQPLIWKDDDWPYLASGNNRPALHAPAPNLPEVIWEKEPTRDDFNDSALSIHFQTPRIPLTENDFSLTERPGFLRLKGAESIESRFHHVMVARRQQALRYTATTVMEFDPENFQQMAGLTCFYNNRLYYYLCMSHDERVGNCLYIQTRDNGEVKYPLNNSVIPLNGATQVYMRADMNLDQLSFFYAIDGERWQRVFDPLDASILSDDYHDEWAFTGAFVGLCCQDLSGARQYADFDFFEYIEQI